MNDLEKAKEIANSYEDDECDSFDIFTACVGMSRWKDEQVKRLLIEKTKLLSSSAAQDSVKRCTIEEIYRELFNEELPNLNPYIKRIQYYKNGLILNPVNTWRKP